MSRQVFNRLSSFNYYRALACDMYYHGYSIEAILRRLYDFSEIGRLEHYLRENEQILLQEREKYQQDESKFGCQPDGRTV